MEQTARLRPPTRAYHLRKADYLARLGDPASADQDAPDGGPRGTNDGVRAFPRRSRALQARGADRRNPVFQRCSSRLQPDHFWAQCLSAICWLQLKRPIEAGAGLNACLKRDPEFAWLYILRGYASSLIPENAGREEVAIRFQAAESDYRVAMERLEQKPNDELRYIVLVNRGLLRLQHVMLDQAATDLQVAIRLDDRPSQAACRAGGGLPQAGQARRGGRTVRTGHPAQTGLGASVPRSSRCEFGGARS